MPARIGPSDRQHAIGFVARVVVVDYLKLRLPELFFELMDRVAGVPSNHCVLSRLKDPAQRPGQQSGEIDQFGHRAEPQDYQHQHAKSLGGRKGTQGKDR
jgi:hypothetical protein